MRMTRLEMLSRCSINIASHDSRIHIIRKILKVATTTINNEFNCASISIATIKRVGLKPG